MFANNDLQAFSGWWNFTNWSVVNQVDSLTKSNFCAATKQSVDIIPIHARFSFQFHYQDHKLNRSHARQSGLPRQCLRSCVFPNNTLALFSCEVLSKLKHYNTQSVLKVVYSSLVHLYITYSILNCGRSSHSCKTIETKSNLTTPPWKNRFPNCMHSQSVSGKFMHCNYNKFLPNHFDEYFIPISSTCSHSKNIHFGQHGIARVNSSLGKCSFTFVGQSVIFNTRLH